MTIQLLVMATREDPTFVALLRACAKNKDLCRGIRVHADILKRGLIGKSFLVANALVRMYAKCAALAKAKEVLDQLPDRDVFSWNALIAGYAQQGHGGEALSCFEQMQHEGLSPNAITFTCILKACGNIGAVDKGKQIHDEIASQGLLGKDIVLGTALVDMYAKCGALGKAQQVLDELPNRDVVAWSALIAGYVQQGQGEGALHCYDRMQHEGISPNAVTFVCILKACGSIGAIDKGEHIHDEITRHGLLDDNNIVLGNALVDMYAKCGALAKAQQVLEELPVRDVFSWSALIAGYTQQGQVHLALNCFERMKFEGLVPDAVIFVYTLNACGNIRAADKGEQIHDEIARQGLLENNVVLGNALVDMYAKCGALSKARQVLEELPIRNVVSWNALIAGYTQQGEGQVALDCFERMQHEGLFPDEVTFTCILKACGNIGAADKGEKIQNEIVRQRLLPSSTVLGNALVDMYAKCGALTKAQQVLDKLPIQNVISWNSLIAGYAQQGHGQHALNCYEQMQRKGLSPDEVTFTCILNACGSVGAADKGEEVHNEIVRQGLLQNNIVLGNALVNMYAKCGALSKAQRVLAELPVRDVVSWSALIAGYAQQDLAQDSINCFEQMQYEGLSPNTVTFIGILKVYGSIGAADKGQQIHDEIVRQGLLGNDILLSNALVDMYVKCGALAKARQVLEGLPFRNVVSWNSLIAGYAKEGQDQDAVICFEKMQHEGLSPDEVTFTWALKACGNIGAVDMGERIHDEIARQGLLGESVVLGIALVDMYAKCGALARARRLLQELPVHNGNSWNALIAGYVQQGWGQDALDCFAEMQRKGPSPDEITYTCILKACGSIGAVDKGEKIHDEIASQGFLGINVVLGNALVDMYAKCGALAKAHRVLEELSVRDVVSWSALIAGYAQHGQAQDALNCLECMQHEGLSPNAVTFSCVLNACNHSGLVDEGQMYFVCLSSKFGITPGLEHYTCMLDLLGRAGHFDKVVEVIQRMPYSDYCAVWSVLLSACGRWGDVNVGRWAFEHVVQVEKSNVPAYVCMANIYAAAGMQEDAENIETMKGNCSDVVGGFI